MSSGVIRDFAGPYFVSVSTGLFACYKFVFHYEFRNKRFELSGNKLARVVINTSSRRGLGLGYRVRIRLRLGYWLGIHVGIKIKLFYTYIY